MSFVFRPISKLPEVKDRQLYSTIIAVDLGFAMDSNESCGVTIFQKNEVTAKPYSFGNLICQIYSTLTEENAGKIALIIEAPLSVQFDEFRSPEARSFESGDQTSREWYNGSGLRMHAAAAILLKELQKKKVFKTNSKDIDVDLYEAFITFKPSEPKGPDDCHKLCHMHESAVFLNRFATSNLGSIPLIPENLTDKYKNLQSIVSYWGLTIKNDDENIPCVISIFDTFYSRKEDWHKEWYKLWNDCRDSQYWDNLWQSEFWKKCNTTSLPPPSTCKDCKQIKSQKR